MGRTSRAGKDNKLTICNNNELLIAKIYLIESIKKGDQF